jgi:PAS domain S-box-containing protein
MYQAIRRWLRNAPVSDPIERELAPLLQIILLLLLVTLLVAVILGALIARAGGNPLTVSALTVIGVLALAFGGALALVRRGYFKTALWVLMTVLVVNQARSIFATNLHTNSLALLSFVIPITIAGLLVGRRALIVVTVICFGVVLAVPIVESVNGTPDVPQGVASLNSVIGSFLFTMTFFVLLLYASGGSFRNALNASIERAKQLELAQQSLETQATELANLNERLSVTLTSIGDAVIATDARGMVTLINQIAQQLTGWTLEEAIGESLVTVFKIVNEKTRMAVENPVDKVMRLGTVVGLANHTLLISKDGSEIPIDDSGAPIRDKQGNISGVVLVFRDITERKQAENRTFLLQSVTAALSEAVTPKQVATVIMENGYQNIGIDSGLVAILSQDRNVLEVLLHYGYSPDIISRFPQFSMDTPNLPMAEAVNTFQPIWIETFDQYAARYPEMAKISQTANRTQAFVCLPLIVEKKAVGALSLSFYKPQHFEEDERAFILAIAQQAAQALERARLYSIERRARLEAEEANRLKLQFLAMISHELRTPLTSIKGFATTLLADDITWDASQQQEFVTIIDQEADKLTDLVEQLLDLSQLQVGALKISPRAESSNVIIEASRAELEALAKDHRLTIEIAPDVTPVMADPQRIAQVITNLVNNAAKYSPANSAIRLMVSQAGEFVQYDVGDEGMGIEPEDRTAVFEAFRQVERKGEGHLKGAGLGLAICKGIIEAHGGKIWIQDQSAPGTTISFTVPIVSSGS